MASVYRCIPLFALFAALCLPGTARSAAARVPPEIAQTVRAAFTQAAAEHAAGFPPVAQPDDSLRYGDWRLEMGNHTWKVLNHATSLETLEKMVRQFAKDGQHDQVAAYCRAAQTWLSDPQPTLRAVACEFLAHHPVDAVDTGALPALAPLLADNTEVFPGVVDGVAGQSRFPRTRITLAETAREACRAMTGLNFVDRTVFARWWQANHNYVKRLWYWKRRFEQAGYARVRVSVIVGRRFTTYNEYEDVRQAEDNARILNAMRANDALKIYILAFNDTALRHEREAPWRSMDEQPPTLYTRTLRDFCSGVNPARVQRFVREQHQQSTLWKLLDGRVEWPEVADADGKGAGQLGEKVLDLLRASWTREDAPAIERLLRHSAGLAGRSVKLQSALALAAAEFSPARREGILRTQLRKDVRQPEVARALLRATGVKDWDIVQPCYQVADPFWQYQIIKALGECNNTAARTILRTLFAQTPLDVELPDPAQGPNDARSVLVQAFAEAAEALSGKPVVLRSLLAVGGGNTIEDDERYYHVNPYDQTMQRARADVLAQLRTFFQE